MMSSCPVHLVSAEPTLDLLLVYCAGAADDLFTVSGYEPLPAERDIWRLWYLVYWYRQANGDHRNTYR